MLAEATRFECEEPVIRIQGGPVMRSGTADRRATYFLSMVVSPEVEAAFLEAAK
jgi:hypothetical protein